MSLLPSILFAAIRAATPAYPPAPLIFDHPAAAARTGANGLVGFDQAIDADGRVTGCAVTTSGGSSILDQGTCREAAGKRFRPTRDEGGRAVAGSYAGTFNHPGPQAEVTIAYRIGLDGRASLCEILRTSGEPALDATACRATMSTFHTAPMHVVDGKRGRLYRGEQRVYFSLAE